MTEHSPAPWFVDLSEKTSHCGIAIRQLDGSIIANVYLHMMDTAWGKDNPINKVENETSKADANLIAAAPDMLRALERVKQLADHGHIFLGEFRQQDVEDAIRKAKGQRP